MLLSVFFLSSLLGLAAGAPTTPGEGEQASFLSAGLSSPTPSLARKIAQLNDAVRNMARSDTAKDMFGDFSWSLTDGVLEQPFHSWYVLVDPKNVGAASLDTIGVPGALAEDPEALKTLLARKADAEDKVKTNRHYFDQIREYGAGSRLAGVLQTLNIASAEDVADDVELWKLLLQSIKLGDADFEHQFGILGDEHATAADAAAAALEKYTFPEIMLLTRSVLFLPALQHVEAMTPGMWADAAKDVEGGPRPILSVGLVAGCVKGPVWKHLAENDPELALELADTNHVGRQIAQIVQAILFSGLDNWVVFSTLPGSGAFATNVGARASDLGPKFFAGLEHGLLAENAHAHAKRVSLYGAPGWFGTVQQISKLNEDIGSELVAQNPRAGIAAQIADDEWGVVIAGFDPVALAPHAAQLRAVSGEGQIGAGTTAFETLGAYPPGSLVKALVTMPRNVADPKAVPKEAPKWVDAKAVRMLPKHYVDDCAAGGGELWLVPSNGTQGPNNDCQQGWDLQCRNYTKSWKTPFDIIGAHNISR